MLNHRFLFGSLFAGALLCIPALAQADVVIEKPLNCPEGTHQETCHGGSYCEPSACKTNAQCGPTAHCETRSLCMDIIMCGGKAAIETPEAVGECINKSCDSGGKCESVQVCVSGSPKDPSPPSKDAAPVESASPITVSGGDVNNPSAGPHPGSGARGCGCEVGAPSPLWAGMLVGAGLLVLGLGRRRRTH